MSDLFQRVIQIYDGIVQGGDGGGGGVTEQRVKELIEATRPGIVVEVHPDFLPSDFYNQYPTVAQGLARADALVLETPGITVLVNVRNSPYSEELLHVRSGVVLNMEPSAALLGLTGDTILVFEESGRCSKVYVQPAIAGIGNPVVLSKENHNAFLMEELSVLNFQAGYSAEVEFENLTNSRSFAYWNTVKVIGVSPAGILVTNASEARIEECLVIQFGGTAVKCVDSGMPSSYNAVDFYNSTLQGSVSSLDLGRYARVPLYNTFVEFEKVVFDPLTPLPERYAAITGGAPQASSVGTQSRGQVETVEDALVGLYDESVIADKRLNSYQNNIAILATQTKQSDYEKNGDYSGMVSVFGDDFVGVDSSEMVHGIDEIDSIPGAMIFGEHTLIDGFDYSNTAALRAVWGKAVVSGPLTNIERSLVLDGGPWPLSPKHMQVDVANAQASGAYVYKSYVIPLDMRILHKLKFWTRGTGMFDFRTASVSSTISVRLVDINGLTASTFSYNLYSQWEEWSFDHGEFTPSAPGFRFDKISRVDFVVGVVPPSGTGSFFIDEVYFQHSEDFIQTGLISDCSSLVELAKWSIMLPLPPQTLSLNVTDQWEGAGCVRYDFQDYFGVRYTPSAPFAIDPTTDTAIRVKARWLAAPAGVCRIGMELVDGIGATVRFPLTHVDQDDLTVRHNEGFSEVVWRDLVAFLPAPRFTWPGDFDYSNIVEIRFLNFGLYPFVAGANALLFDYLEFGRVPHLETVEFDPGFDWDLNHAIAHMSYFEYALPPLSQFAIEASLDVAAPPYFNVGFPRTGRRSFHAGYDEPYSDGCANGGVEYDLAAPQTITTVRARVMARSRLTLFGFSVFWRR